MRKGIVILLIVAAALVLVGGAIFTVGVITMSNQNISFINGQYQKQIHNGTDEIKSISITTGTPDVEILPYDKEGYKVECFEDKKIAHTVTVENGTLRIERNDTRAWYDYINVFSMDTKITVYVPAGEYSSLSVDADTSDVTVSKNFTFEKADITCTTGNIEFNASTKSALTIRTSTGDIEVEKSTHGNLDLSVSSGEIEIKDVDCTNATVNVSTGKTEIKDMTCTSFTSTGNTGSLLMSNLVSAGEMSITRNTGDVKFDKCDAANITVSTGTGNVTGTLLSPKIFIHSTSTGNVSLPETTTGGKCKITTSTGDIKISIIQ